MYKPDYVLLFTVFSYLHACLSLHLSVIKVVFVFPYHLSHKFFMQVKLSLKSDLV